MQKLGFLKNIGPWQQLSDEIKYDNPWITVHHQEVLNPNGNPGIYGKIHFKNLAIGILPIDAEGNIWLVGQHRYPFDEYTWEIPEGGGPLADSPLASAQRELLEETGVVAENWTTIQEVQLSNSVSDEKGIIFIATQLTQKQAQPEDTEQLEIKKVPLTQAIEMVHSGKITDSLSVIALLKAEILILKNQLSY